MIVHSEDGMDEISPFSKTKIIELNTDKIKKFIIDPNELNILNKNKDNLKGKNAEYNAQKIIDIYRGADNEFSDAVALNVGAGLIITDREKNFKVSYLSAKEHLKSGKVYSHLKKIQAI
jgi:anthranilate phosphoribosyltransferase